MNYGIAVIESTMAYEEFQMISALLHRSRASDHFQVSSSALFCSKPRMTHQKNQWNANQLFFPDVPVYWNTQAFSCEFINNASNCTSAI